MYSVYKASNVVYISHSGVSLLAESVSVCVRRALEVALTSFTPTLSVPQRLEREERRLKEMLDGQSLLAALGQVDALLTSLDRLVVAIIIIHKHECIHHVDMVAPYIVRIHSSQVMRTRRQYSCCSSEGKHDSINCNYYWRFPYNTIHTYIHSERNICITWLEHGRDPLGVKPGSLGGQVCTARSGCTS